MTPGGTPSVVRKFPASPRPNSRSIALDAIPVRFGSGSWKAAGSCTSGSMTADIRPDVAFTFGPVLMYSSPGTAFRRGSGSRLTPKDSRNRRTSGSVGAFRLHIGASSRWVDIEPEPMPARDRLRQHPACAGVTCVALLLRRCARARAAHPDLLLRADPAEQAR